jgi:hypothetical protein
VVFYTLIFAAVAVLAIIAGVIYLSRNRRRLEAEEHQAAHNAHKDRRNTKARRTQSKKARRQRH